MAAGTAIAPLTNSQKLFLQRLLVSHVLTDDHARQLYQSIKEGFANVAPSRDEDDDEGVEHNGDVQGYMGNNLEHCLGIINASLVPAFNLEVCTVSLPPLYGADGDNDDGAPQQRSQASAGSGGGKDRVKLVKYHAIVNRSNDGVAKSYAFPLSKGGPHDMAYFRLAIEKIVERGVDMLEESGSGGAGCPGTLSRMELINIRTDMEGAHKDKLTISQTEHALDILEDEGWLVQVAPSAQDDDDMEADGQEIVRHKRKRRICLSSPASSGGSRRKSLKGTFYGLGPRSFMELGEFLQKAGLPGDKMPQSILHRI